MWLCFLILSINLVDGQSADAIYPSNTAVKSGTNFSFVCGTLSDGVTPQWKFRQENTYGELSLYNGTHIMDASQDFAVVTTSKGISTLMKNTSRNDDAGTYICIERKKRDSIANVSSAQLIVLDNDPVCKVSKESIMIGEHLQMECIVNYYGSIFPVVKWSRSDGINLVAHDYMNTSAVVSNLTIQMTIKENLVTFMARIYFNQPLSSSNTNGVHKATNAPNYEFTWTHKPNVLYEPRSVVITQKKDVYLIGDILLCVADGNPSPSYEWTELESTLVISRLPSLIIENIRMENHVYKCMARNNVSDKEATSISTTVTIHAVRRPAKTGFDTVRSVTIVAGIACVVLVVVAFAIALRRLKGCVRSCRLRESETGPDRVQNGDKEENDRNSCVANVTLDQGHEYESTEMFGMQEDRRMQPQNIDKLMESVDSTQLSSEEQGCSVEHQNHPTRVCTCYATLGEHLSNPGPTVYERLNQNEVIFHTASDTPVVRPEEKTQKIYANATSIVLDGNYVNVKILIE